MKKFRLLFFLCCSISIHFNVEAQNIDSTKLEINLPFQKYDPVIGARIDSIGASFGFIYNELIHNEIMRYDLRKGEMGQMIGLSEYYFPYFEKALADFNLPDELKYLPVIESSLNPLAVSVSGAAGLWQFMPSTGKGYGLQIGNFEDQRHDPELSSYAAATYLRDMYAEFGDWLLTLAAYNTGAGTVRRAMQKHGVNNYWDLRPYLSEQGQKYIPKFIGTLYTMKFAEALGVICKESNLELPLEGIVIHNTITFKQLSSVLDIQEDLLHTLNPTYKRKVVHAEAGSLKTVLLPQIPVQKYSAFYDLLNNQSLYTDSRNLAHTDDEQWSGNFSYAVVRGDNLTKIANKFKVSTQDLMKANNMKSDALIVGQKLKVPQAPQSGPLASN